MHLWQRVTICREPSCIWPCLVHRPLGRLLETLLGSTQTEQLLLSEHYVEVLAEEVRHCSPWFIIRLWLLAI